LKKVLLISNNSYSAVGGIQEYRRFLVQALINNEYKIDFLYKDKLIQKKIFNVNFINILQQFKLPKFLNLIINIFNIIFNKYDAILITHINYVIFAPFLKIFFKKKIFLFIYGIDAKNLNFFKKTFSKFCDLVISHSNYTKQNFLNNFKGFRKMVVTISGPYIEGQFIRKKINKKKNIVITSVTRVDKTDKYKNINKIILILKYLKEKNINFTYNLVGSGNFLPNIRQKIKKYNLTNNIIIHGWIDDDQRNLILKNTDIYLLPSDGEGFGLSFIEAVKFGAITIGSVTDGSREALSFGKYGYLVDPNDKKLNEKIHQIIFLKNHNEIEKLNQDYHFKTFSNKLNQCINKKNGEMITIFTYDNNKRKIKSISNVSEGLAVDLFWRTNFNLNFIYQSTSKNIIIDIIYKYILTFIKILLLNFYKKRILIFSDQGLSIYGLFYFKKKILICHDVLNQLILKKIINVKHKLNNSFIYRLILYGIKKINIISVSATTKNNLLTLGIKPKNIKYTIYSIFHLINEHSYYPKRIFIDSYNDKNNLIFVTIITSNAWYKRDDQLPKIIQTLSKNKNIFFNIISLNKSKIMSKIENFKNTKVHYNVSDFKKNVLLSNSTFLIHNSDYEGFGLPIIEALKNSVIVFCKNTRHFRELYDNKLNYYDIDNLKKISNTISKLSKNNRQLNLKRKESFIIYEKILSDFNKSYKDFVKKEITNF